MEADIENRDSHSKIGFDIHKEKEIARGETRDMWCWL